jgi:hypothetical protein
MVDFGKAVTGRISGLALRLNGDKIFVGVYDCPLMDFSE